jgi:hypothetical protein
MHVSPLVQDTVQALAVAGGFLKRIRRQLIVQQGEIEKSVNEVDRQIRIISDQEKKLKAAIEAGEV